VNRWEEYQEGEGFFSEELPSNLAFRVKFDILCFYATKNFIVFFRLNLWLSLERK
jgi:hypothetical protein